MSAAGPRRWTVFCMKYGCGWRGSRTADTREGSQVDPCPKCGYRVSQVGGSRNP